MRKAGFIAILGFVFLCMMAYGADYRKMSRLVQQAAKETAQAEARLRKAGERRKNPSLIAFLRINKN